MVQLTNPLSLRPRAHSPYASASKSERGMVLIVVLIMLTVLTVLGITTMGNTTMEERMASNMQEYNRAFQVSESGIAKHLREPDAKDTASPGSPITHTYNFRNNKETVTTESWYQVSSTLPPPGFSGTFKAHYYSLRSDGKSQGGASSLHHQGFYIVGP